MVSKDLNTFMFLPGYHTVTVLYLACTIFRGFFLAHLS